ncbi:MFS transporter [Actinoplanes auranticolor]|nr:MFS transporter [Actinoplanes auranticolor]
MTATDSVFRVREFRYVWAAEVLSIAGDQLARVALAVLVYGRTGSAAWAAVVYALTFLPALFGGVLLAGLADRYRRREVMVAADLLRAVLVAVMALPGLPLPWLAVLLFLVVLAGTPFTAAQGALLPEILPGARYERGLAVRQITGQSAQLLGFATGGILVAAIEPGPALLGNATTFLVSAVLIRAGLADRPRPVPESRDDLRTSVAVRGLRADPRRRALLALAWMVGWYVVPEALAAPYADQIGAGPAAVGLLMAADPLGSIAGAWLFVRLVPERIRDRLIGVLAVGAGLPLLLTAAQPGVAMSMALWGLSGMFSTAYLIQAQAGFVRSTPEGERGRAIGVAASGLLAAQGVAVLAGGWAADHWDAATAITGAALAGIVLCAAAAVALRSADHRAAG